MHLMPLYNLKEMQTHYVSHHVQPSVRALEMPRTFQRLDGTWAGEPPPPFTTPPTLLGLSLHRTMTP